ncbi:MAG: hypothetical protein U1G07_13300 [Verrucomicrobiota bacterium]
MKTEQSDQGDGRLGEMLQTWKVTASLPPGFQDRVWQRIAREEAPSAALWQRLGREIGARWRSLLAQPAGATAYLAALLMLGAALGYWQSEHYTLRAERAWRTAYLQSVNPAAGALEQ